MNGTLDGIVNDRIFDGGGFVLPHAMASFNDGGYNIHAPDMENRLIKRLCIDEKNVDDTFGYRLQNESRECDFHANSR
jgi:hypothetical protein